MQLSLQNYADLKFNGSGVSIQFSLVWNLYVCASKRRNTSALSKSHISNKRTQRPCDTLAHGDLWLNNYHEQNIGLYWSNFVPNLLIHRYLHVYIFMIQNLSHKEEEISALRSEKKDETWTEKDVSQ